MGLLFYPFETTVVASNVYYIIFFDVPGIGSSRTISAPFTIDHITDPNPLAYGPK
jgi:hypothetical protein